MKKQSFEGLCSFGIHEIVYPVIHEGTTLCIIYIGNFLIDRTQSIEKLKKTVKKTGTDYHALLSEMNKMPVVDSSKKYWSMAEFIADYILYNLSNIKYTNTEHWLVKLMKDNIRSNYEQSLTLKMFAKMYYMNEKYLGRIFKKQTGMSFHQYLLNTRLRHAASMLEHTNDTIISISIKCGFASSSYFDSSFVKKYNMTPKVYQKKFRSAES